MPEGDHIVVVYLELLCISLQSDGYVYTRGIYPTLEEDIALELGEDVITVRLALAALEKAKLLEVGAEDRNLMMTDFQSMVGSETDSARRVRKCGENKRKIESVTMKHFGNSQKCGEAECNGEKETEKETESEIKGKYENYQCGEDESY